MFELTLPTMTCGHCVKTVTDTLQKLDPAAKLAIDLPSHKVQIETACERSVVEQALAHEGYKAA